MKNYGEHIFIIIELIFCFLLVTEGFLWHKSLSKKKALKREKKITKKNNVENHVTAKYICPKICIGVSTGNINGMEDLKPVFLIILRQAFYYKFIVLR